MAHARGAGGDGRGARRGGIPAAVLVALLAGLASCKPAPPPAEAPRAADGWREFGGTWTAAGTRRTISLGAARSATIVDLRGTLLLAGAGRPGVGFRGDAVGLADSATGFTGRAVWTDEQGDEIYSELRGEGAATGKRITGTFLGGTGRYAGATGTYELGWQYVLDADDGTVQGRATGLTGRIRAGAPAAAPAAEGPK